MRRCMTQKFQKTSKTTVNTQNEPVKAMNRLTIANIAVMLPKSGLLQFNGSVQFSEIFNKLRHEYRQKRYQLKSLNLYSTVLETWLKTA